MSFLKKNLLLCIVAAVCVAAFLAGVYMALAEYRAIKDARRSLASAESQLSSLHNADPVPTEENLAAAEKNLAELQAALADIREDLRSDSEMSTSKDGVSVMAGIQQYISKFQKQTAAHKNEFGEAAPIETPDNFAFGFGQYIDEASVPADGPRASLLDKQRQILNYLITQLIQAGPQSIDKVLREILEAQEGDSGKNAFTINPAISARVPGAIDTMAFSITFSGYTDSLREFLNSLASFEWPIVVRSIEVTRPSGSETVVAPPRRDNAANIFDLFAEDDASAGTEDSSPETGLTAEEQKPVIEENISQFTVILEFIEVILPDTQTQEVSDPA